MRTRQTDERRANAESDRPWSTSVAVAEVAETGRHVDLTPDGPTREALARLARVAAFPSVRASFDLLRVGRDGLRVVGRVSATVEQTCVVTLEPVLNEIDEAVDLVFVPPTAALRTPKPAVARVLDAGEPPEVLQDGAVDLGALATEYLILGIDPYPRKAGTAIETLAVPSDPSTHPFAALAALKRENGGNGR